MGWNCCGALWWQPRAPLGLAAGAPRPHAAPSPEVGGGGGAARRARLIRGCERQRSRASGIECCAARRSPSARRGSCGDPALCARPLPCPAARTGARRFADDGPGRASPRPHPGRAHPAQLPARGSRLPSRARRRTRCCARAPPAQPPEVGFGGAWAVAVDAGRRAGPFSSVPALPPVEPTHAASVSGLGLVPRARDAARSPPEPGEKRSLSLIFPPAPLKRPRRAWGGCRRRPLVVALGCGVGGSSWWRRRWPRAYLRAPCTGPLSSRTRPPTFHGPPLGQRHMPSDPTRLPRGWGGGNKSI